MIYFLLIEIEQAIWLLMHALQNCPIAKGPVFRGIRGREAASSYNEGKTITWSCFSSCTTSISLLTSSAYLGNGTDSVILQIELTTGRGRDISKYAFSQGEQEILLPPNTRFKIISKAFGDDGRIHIHLRELTPIDPIMNFKVTIHISTHRVTTIDSLCLFHDEKSPTLLPPLALLRICHHL